MFDVDRYRLVYILKMLFLIPVGLLIPMFALGMKEHPTIPISLYFYLLFFLFEVLMLSIPLFIKIRNNVKFKPVFIVNMLILVFNIGVLVFDSLNSDIDGGRIFIYVYVSLVSLYLMNSNYNLFKTNLNN